MRRSDLLRGVPVHILGPWAACPDGYIHWDLTSVSMWIYLRDESLITRLFFYQYLICISLFYLSSSTDADCLVMMVILDRVRSLDPILIIDSYYMCRESEAYIISLKQLLSTME